MQIKSKTSILFLALIVALNSFEIFEDSNVKENEDPAIEAASYQKVYESEIKSISMRLTPNQDIMTQITKLLNDSPHKKKYTALSIVSAVGSVNYCWLRMANQSTLTKIKGPMEIVSLSGTFDLNLDPHVHISLSRATGQTLGGHLPSIQERQQTLKSQDNFQGQIQDQIPFDCPIFTTLELVLLSHENVIYRRKIDPVTTFHQLTIQNKHFYSK